MNERFLPWFNPNVVSFNGPDFGFKNRYDMGKKLPFQQGVKMTSGLSMNPQTQARMGSGVAANGAESGLSADNVAGAAFGAANLFMGAKQMGDAANAINTTAPSEMLDANGRPVYNLGQFAADTQAIDPQGATGGEILSGAGQGAAIGGAIVPGLGHAIGAVGGALVNVFGGARRKRKMREKKRARARSLSAKQGRYNSQMQSYYSERLAQESYQKGLDNTNRLYNIYNTIT